MTRHAKNATASSCYTYHERRKDAKTSGYGTLHERLGKDSMKPFDCCSLTLQPCRFTYFQMFLKIFCSFREPLISPQGFIFDREAILNYILDQKEAYKRKLKIWEQQRRIDMEKKDAVEQREKDKLKAKFIALESAPVPQKIEVPSTPSVRAQKRGPAPANGEAGGNFEEDEEEIGGPSSSKKMVKRDEEAVESVSNMTGERAKQWRSFWVPELTTTAEPDRIEKPVRIGNEI